MLQRLLLLLRLWRGAAAAALFGNNGGRGAGALERLIAFWHGTGNGFSDAGTLLLLCFHLQCAQVRAATEACSCAATAATAAAAGAAGVGCAAATVKEFIKVPVTQELRFVAANADAARLRRVRGGSRFL